MDILEECKQIVAVRGQCLAGDTVITNAGKLLAKKVIYTVGPIWEFGNADEVQKLTSCYQKSLQLAEDNGFKSIAFPNISTGVYRFPKEDAAKIAVNTVKTFKSNIIEKVVFVCYDSENYEIYKRYLSV